MTTAKQTTFVAPLANVYEDSLSDTQQSDQIVQSIDNLMAYKLKGSNASACSLLASEHRAFSVGALSDNDFIMIRVIGQVELQTNGKDFDGTTNIAGLSRTYGTSLFPGFIVLSTYNLTVVNIIAITDSYVQIFDSTLN